MMETENKKRVRCNKILSAFENGNAIIEIDGVKYTTTIVKKVYNSCLIETQNTVYYVA